jgi:prolyl-tRNA synthetase
MMQDNKALQAGTTHHLGQNFAKAFEVQYQTADGGLDHVWSTSWGVSTRMVGGLIMTHSDDTGLVCPPRLAPIQVVLVPIWKSAEQKTLVLEVGAKVLAELQDVGVRVELDDRDEMKPGAKYYEWESRGVPIRLEIGPRDVENEQAMMARRTGGKDPVKLGTLAEDVRAALDEMQGSLYAAAVARRDDNSVRNVSKDQLIELMDGVGGFAYGGFCGAESCEMAIKDRTKAAVRVLPDEEFRSDPSPTKCAWCGADSAIEAMWAKAY